MADTGVTTPRTDSGQEEVAPRRGGRWRPLRYLTIAAVAIVGIAYGGLEVWSRFTHVYEYDARIKADMIMLASKVNGLITEISVNEGQAIRKGQILARLDDRVPRFRVEALKAEIAGVEAERNRLVAERSMLDAQTSTKMRTRESGFRASQAERSALMADLNLARSELKRAETLFKRRVIAKNALDKAQAAVRRLEGDLRKIDAESQAAQDQVAEAQADRQRLDVLDTELAVIEHRAARLKAELSQQTVAVADRLIRSPTDGMVDRIFVATGEFVNNGRRMLLVHDPEQVWVEANIKETELRLLRIGQPVEVIVDAFPETGFAGTVTRIGSATTANFALLPTPNPSGNFTKITQRVPVKIELETGGERLLPGMMVEVNIDIRDR